MNFLDTFYTLLMGIWYLWNLQNFILFFYVYSWAVFDFYFLVIFLLTLFCFFSQSLHFLGLFLFFLLLGFAYLKHTGFVLRFLVNYFFLLFQIFTLFFLFFFKNLYIFFLVKVNFVYAKVNFHGLCRLRFF